MLYAKQKHCFGLLGPSSVHCTQPYSIQHTQTHVCGMKHCVWSVWRVRLHMARGNSWNEIASAWSGALCGERTCVEWSIACGVYRVRLRVVRGRVWSEAASAWSGAVWGERMCVEGSTACGVYRVRLHIARGHVWSEAASVWSGRACGDGQCLHVRSIACRNAVSSHGDVLTTLFQTHANCTIFANGWHTR